MVSRMQHRDQLGVTSEPLLEKALISADLNALRMALYQATGDEALAVMRVVHRPVWGGVMMMDALAPEHHEEVRRKARDYLLNRPANVAPPPSTEKAYRLLEISAGAPLSRNQLRMGVEELAFDDFPQDVRWNNRPSGETLRKKHVTIIGAGVSAIAVGVQLTRLGIPYTIYERQPGVGGTWQINNYPEARVDIPSYNYQYHFEKNYKWPNYFSDRDANLKYLRHIADKYGVTPNIRLGTEVTAADWSESDSKWTIRLRTDGKEESVRSDFLLSACGLFNKPKYPDIPGIETFQGEIYHTTAWNPTYDYSGKRVALIGNGSTGSQTLPALAEKAKSAVVFMRTAHWVFPMEDYKALVAPEVHWLFDTMPYYWNWYCYSGFVMTLRMQDLGEYDREWQAKGGLVSERNDKLRKVLTESIRARMASRPDLVDKLIPTWSPMARRPIVDAGWYDALLRDNVELVTSPIERFTTTGIVTKDGVERPLDLVALAAGFEVSRFLWPVKYTGRGGITLEKAWAKDGARSYLGMMIAGFPNFFIFYGPNGQPRAAGFHTWAERWAHYTAQAIVHVIEKDKKSLELKQEVFDKYNADLDFKATNLLRNVEGRGSYHVNEFGRMVVNVPWLAEDYAAMIRTPNFDDFIER
jgi:4-hydroxyacetophenone monooxygenase